MRALSCVVLFKVQLYYTIICYNQSNMCTFLPLTPYK
jgi:hypothetical protein